MVVVSWVYTYLHTYHVIYINHVHLFMCQKNKKKNWSTVMQLLSVRTRAHILESQLQNCCPGSSQFSKSTCDRGQPPVLQQGVLDRLEKRQDPAAWLSVPRLQV